MKKNRKSNPNNIPVTKPLTNNQAKLVYEFIDNCDNSAYHLTSAECKYILDALNIYGKRHSEFDSRKHVNIAEEKIASYNEKVMIAFRTCVTLMNELLSEEAFDDPQYVINTIDEQSIIDLAVIATDEYIEIQRMQ